VSEPPQRALFWAVGIALCILALWLLSGILLPFVAGFTIAYFLNPPCDRLERLRLPRGAAAAIVLLGFVLAVALVFLVLVPLIETQVIDLVRRFPSFVDIARSELNSLMGFFQERLSPEDYAKLRDAVGVKLGDAFSWVGRLLQGTLSSSLALFNIAIKAVKIGLAQGIHNVFVLSMGLMIAGLIVVFFLKEIPLRGGRSRDAAITEAVEDVSPEGNMAAMI